MFLCDLDFANVYKRLVFPFFIFCCWHFRQQRLQFRPPFEEIKAKYFREMKKFIGIPNHFKGVSEGVESPVFPAIIIRNAEGFVACYKKAAGLFSRLAAVLDKFSVSCPLLF